MPASTTQLPKTEQQQNHRLLYLGMLTWFIHENLIYGLNNVSCKWAFLNNNVDGLAALQWLEIAIAVIALALIAWVLVLSWQNWRIVQTARPARSPDTLQRTEQDRGGFLAFLAIGLNFFALLFVLGTLIPMLTLKACGQA